MRIAYRLYLMKHTALAPANIALIKYWGKKDESLRLPLNDSLSINIDGATTKTTIEIDEARTEDEISFVDEQCSEKEKQKIIEHINRIFSCHCERSVYPRNKVSRAAISSIKDKSVSRHTESRPYVKVVTQNSFPKGTGIASSASGFAALTVAASKAFGLNASEKELSILSRIGSGSACRSIPDGWVQWYEGTDSASSFAQSIAPSDWWDVRDAIIICSKTEKKVSSTAGMESAHTSPLMERRLSEVTKRMEQMKIAIQQKDMNALGSTLEADCLDMHAVMQSQVPPLYYWSAQTKEIMEAVKKWRNEGLQIFFTIDAGPNVHMIYEGKDEEKVKENITKLEGIEGIIYNKIAKGTVLSPNHLF